MTQQHKLPHIWQRNKRLRILNKQTNHKCYIYPSLFSSPHQQLGSHCCTTDHIHWPASATNVYSQTVQSQCVKCHWGRGPWPSSVWMRCYSISGAKHDGKAGKKQENVCVYKLVSFELCDRRRGRKKEKEKRWRVWSLCVRAFTPSLRRFTRPRPFTTSPRTKTEFCEMAC